MKSSGMTLLEVLVALAVFAFAALALIKAVTQQTVGLSALEEKTLANWVAENQLVELRLKKVWPEKNWVSGSSEMAGQKWYWRYQGVDTADPRLRAVDIEVSLQAPKNATTAGPPRTTLRSYVVKS